MAGCTPIFHPVVGTADDVGYAQLLWSALSRARMVGKHASHEQPFIGAAQPHGWVLELHTGRLPVAGHTGFVIVKHNYHGKAIRVEDVERDRARYLASISVMYQREAGYDPDNKDWFWVQYTADGELASMTKMGMKIVMAGRLIKGASRSKNRGCLYCHSSAGGGDYVFYPEIVVPQAQASPKQ